MVFLSVGIKRCYGIIPKATRGHASRMCCHKCTNQHNGSNRRRAGRHLHAWHATHRPGDVACMHRLRARAIAATYSTRSMAVAALPCSSLDSERTLRRDNAARRAAFLHGSRLSHQLRACQRQRQFRALSAMRSRTGPRGATNGAFPVTAPHRERPWQSRCL